MIAANLTLDNPPLSEPKHVHSDADQLGEINCTNMTAPAALAAAVLPREGDKQLDAINCTDLLPDRIADLVRNSLAGNTRRAYLFDLGHFEAVGGDSPRSPPT